MENAIITTENKVVIKDIKDYMQEFSDFAQVSAKSIQTYKRSLQQFYNYLLINGITAPKKEDVIEYKKSLEKEHKPTTVQAYLAAVKVFYSWAEEKGYYTNIAKNVKGEKLDRDHKKDYLTSSQVKDVLEGISRDNLQGIRDYAIMRLMITGGLRTIEVSRANIEDMRPLGNFTVLYVQGKGRTERTEYVKLPKATEKAIRDYLQARGKASDTDPLFVSTSNNNRGERMTTRTISAIAKEHMQAAGYDSSRLTAHSLRHTAVTLSLQAGLSPEEVQQFARHANLNTTMIYSHALEKQANGCAQAIENMIG